MDVVFVLRCEELVVCQWFIDQAYRAKERERYSQSIGTHTVG